MHFLARSCNISCNFLQKIFIYGYLITLLEIGIARNCKKYCKIFGLGSCYTFKFLIMALILELKLKKTRKILNKL